MGSVLDAIESLLYYVGPVAHAFIAIASHTG